jgi:lysophospholipase
MIFSNILWSLLCMTLVAAAPQPRGITPYAPVSVNCPSNPLVRTADGIGSEESNYVASRKAVANTALASWLSKTNSGFDTSKLPILGLTTSGGGYRSLLTGAGVIKAWDSRDSNLPTSGIAQALTYHAGLSGGGWLVNSLIGNNMPTVTSIKNALWKTAFANGVLFPTGLFAPITSQSIVADTLAKQIATIVTSLTDISGRQLSYQLFQGASGGVSTRLSSIPTLSNFKSYNVPFPIITAVGVQPGSCQPGMDAPIYEMTPYEFGSFDSGIEAMMQMSYLGSPLKNGKTTGQCVQNFDNIGFITATTSNIFATICPSLPVPGMSGVMGIGTAASLLTSVHGLGLGDEYSLYPNPFYELPNSNAVASQSVLQLVDGGLSGQQNPIWPLLQPSRNVDIIIVNDNSDSDNSNFPDGSDMYQTYQRAQAAGLTRMPVIPPPSTFTSQGLNKKPVFFGCNDNSKATIVYIPNTSYSYNSGQSTAKLQYSASETESMLANGVLVGTMNGDSQFPTCLGCAFMKKMGTNLPSACQNCFSRFCYN